jgi:hypothetical protein
MPRWGKLCERTIQYVKHRGLNLEDRKETERLLLQIGNSVTELWGADLEARRIGILDRIRDEAAALQRWAVDVESSPAERTPSDDESAFVPAVTLRKDGAHGITSPQKMNKFLANHPEIRKRKKDKKSLEVHAGDWHNHWQQEDDRQFEAIDNIEDAIAEQAQRQTVERKRKQQRGEKRKSKVPFKFPSE